MMQTLKVKILLLGAEDSPRGACAKTFLRKSFSFSPISAAVRVELTSESDLFFHYMHLIEEKSYGRVQEAQQLVVEFSDYPTVLMRMLNAVRVSAPLLSPSSFN